MNIKNFSGTQPNLLYNYVLSDLNVNTPGHLVINVPQINTPFWNFVHNMYDKYIVHNIVPLLIILAFALYLFYRYVSHKNKKDTKDDQENFDIFDFKTNKLNQKETKKKNQKKAKRMSHSIKNKDENFIHMNPHHPLKYQNNYGNYIPDSSDYFLVGNKRMTYNDMVNNGYAQRIPQDEYYITKNNDNLDTYRQNDYYDEVTGKRELYTGFNNPWQKDFVNPLPNPFYQKDYPYEADDLTKTNYAAVDFSTSRNINNINEYQNIIAKENYQLSNI